MKSGMIGLVAAVVLAAGLTGCSTMKIPPVAHPDTGGWTPVYGAALEKAEFPKGVWWVTNGLLTSSRDEAIWTKRIYTNYVLDLEFKLEPGANSGVLLFCTDPQHWLDNHIEVQILDDNAPKWAKETAISKCAGIYGHLAPTKSLTKAPGEWNRMTITVKGNMIWVLFNGEQVTVMDRTKWTALTKNPDGSNVPPWLHTLISKPTCGKIGLQGAHGGIPSWFRNIRIKELE